MMQEQKYSKPLLATCLLVLLSCLVVLTQVRAYDDDDDDNKCRNLEHLKYELFGTKTIYDDARKYLQRVDDDDLPKPFDDDSLEEEHKDLVEDHCEPQVFYFIGRHSARFPDSEDIEVYNKHLSELLRKMNSTTSGVSKKCLQRRDDFFKWQSKMQARHDNLITHLGALEERDIARRFKRLYPEFFDADKAKIEIGVTKKVRTAQTASAFLEEVKGLNLNECQTKPTDDVDAPNYNLDKVLEAACYKHLIDKYERPFLEFHKQCDKISGDKKIKDPRIDRVKNPALMKRIIDRVANKLGLDNSGPEPPVTPEVLSSIFNMCKFENAMRNNSVWCDLFSRQDIEALEYIEDVNSYIKSAYGPQARPQQSCPLVKDLLEALEAGQNMTTSEPKRSHFYFSHADPIKKLLATFELFKDDESFSEQSIADFEHNLKTPKRRHWRSSVITPFSGNLAFVLYRCQKSSRKPPKFKVLATVTEQPVKLGGCSDTDCSSQRFFQAYENLRSCDLDKICARS